ncbi:prolyl oligopeptidase PreP (S9A serine peptidase family) [Bradyrhizobium sp. JR4.1]|uniref:hypothetical protein n=1 Tax=Bradyrhizobium sp. JR4.1 TaxID=3156372 RepID=UPI0033916938
MEELSLAEAITELLLDIDHLAVSEDEDWFLNATVAPPGNQPPWLLGLSRGGSDAVTFREFDTDTKLFIHDGFIVPKRRVRAYGSSLICWCCQALGVRAWPRPAAMRAW